MGGGTGEKSSLDGATPLRLQDHPYLTPSGSPMVQPEPDSKFGHLDTREQVTACVAIAKRAGLDFLVLDQTRPDIEAPVVRVIVPGCGISIVASRLAGFTMCRSSSDGVTGR